MKVFRKLFVGILVVLTVVLFSLNPNKVLVSVQADDEDFENNYDYYCELCTTKTNLTDAEKEICLKFKEYEEQRQEELKKLLEEAQNNLNEMKQNILKEGQKIESYNNQISSLNKQIDAINASITKIEENIEQLNLQISQRQEKIDELNEQIKLRMVANQTNVVTNSYIKFIMGANSFIDLLRRISAVSEITDYDLSKIEQMNEEKELYNRTLMNYRLRKIILLINKHN